MLKLNRIRPAPTPLSLIALTAAVAAVMACPTSQASEIPALRCEPRGDATPWAGRSAARAFSMTVGYETYDGTFTLSLFDATRPDRPDRIRTMPGARGNFTTDLTLGQYPGSLRQADLTLNLEAGRGRDGDEMTGYASFYDREVGMRRSQDLFCRRERSEPARYGRSYECTAYGGPQDVWTPYVSRSVSEEAARDAAIRLCINDGNRRRTCEESGSRQSACHEFQTFPRYPEKPRVDLPPIVVQPEPRREPPPVVIVQPEPRRDERPPVYIPQEPVVDSKRGELRGNIDGVVNENGQWMLTGWACVVGLNQTLQVHVYAGHAFRNGDSTNLNVAQGLAGERSEPAINAICQIPNGAFRFKMPIAPMLSAYPQAQGMAVFVHGINPPGTQRQGPLNPLLQSSGSYRFPTLR